MKVQIREPRSKDLVEAAFVDSARRPDYSKRVFDLLELLTPRCRTWLDHQLPGRREAFLQSCTSNPRHFRRLEYNERSSLDYWTGTRDMTDEQYAAHRRRQRDLVEHMGQVMLDHLIEAANRPGFMRRFLAPAEHTVPEATLTELKLARRIQTRTKPPMPLRKIVQLLHTQRK